MFLLCVFFNTSNSSHFFYFHTRFSVLGLDRKKSSLSMSVMHRWLDLQKIFDFFYKKTGSVDYIIHTLPVV